MGLSIHCHINNKSNNFISPTKPYFSVWSCLWCAHHHHLPIHNKSLSFKLRSMLYLSANIQTDKTYETININNRIHHTVTTETLCTTKHNIFVVTVRRIEFWLRYIIYNTTAHYTRNAKLSPFIFELITSTILLSVCFHCITDLRPSV